MVHFLCISRPQAHDRPPKHTNRAAPAVLRGARRKSTPHAPGSPSKAWQFPHQQGLHALEKPRWRLVGAIFSSIAAPPAATAAAACAHKRPVDLQSCDFKVGRVSRPRRALSRLRTARCNIIILASSCRAGSACIPPPEPRRRHHARVVRPAVTAARLLSGWVVP
jgi:hypothetical protein